ncbi:MAG: FG-GAP repeat domain-containing protein [Anaerolineae bacterium]
MRQVQRTTMLCVLLGLLIAAPLTHNGPASATIEPATIQADYTAITLNGGLIIGSAPTAADFNGDGYKEIVVGGSDGILHVVSFNGSTWSEVWSHQTNIDINAAGPEILNSDNNIRTSQAVADLENDGHLDIVVTVGGFVHTDTEDRRNGGVLVYRYQSASPWSFALIEPLSQDGTQGWPQPRIDQIGAGPGEGQPDGLWDGIPTSPTVGDIDGDGDLEVIVLGMDRRIHAWHHNGAAVSGWPISQWNGDPLWRGGRSSPALGDIDGDGLPEVVVGTMSPVVNGEQDQNATLWAVNGDSSLVPGFPIQTEQHIHSSPALGDIDGDGQLEIVVGVGQGITSGRTNIVYAWNHDGTPVQTPGGLLWPRETTNTVLAPPALGDIDGDGELEIVIGEGGYSPTDNNKLYAWNADGSLVPGFPLLVPSPSPWATGSLQLQYTPILADFDGDGTIEILVNHINSWGFVVVEPDGTVSDIDGHPMRQGLWASPMVDDIDDDGLLEIVAASGDADENGEVRIWDESGAATSALPWPMFHHDITRTGLSTPRPALGFPSQIKVFHQQGSGVSESTMISIWNKGGGSFDWILTPSTGLIQLSPTSGTLTKTTSVQLTVDTSGLANGWTTVGQVTATATDEGVEISGSPQTASVSVYVGDVQRIYLPTIARRH